mmetsp:Transcript_15459/g.27417  ORF Transcript_15459/g.27417 Transcript_15459/m.27417 type:complete len:596 (-) Transcript_15459:74-1861(-)
MVKLLAQPKLKGVVQMGPGVRVQVQGLQNNQELNGQTGHLLQFDPAKLRWGVELEGGKQVLLKMGNLIPLGDVAPATTDELTGQPKPADAPVACDSAVPETVITPADVDKMVAEFAVDRSAGSGSRAACEIDCPPEDAAVPALDGEGADDNWPVLPTSAETQEKIRSGCWWDGGSAAKRFTEQLRANDPSLVSVVLVPPKRFNDEDAIEICDALEGNEFCRELVASGHSLSSASCERIAAALRSSKSLEVLSVGDSQLGALGSLIFDGLGGNLSLTSLDLEQKGLTAGALCALAEALASRHRLGAPALKSLSLSRNKCLGEALSQLVAAPPPAQLKLCDCALGASHGKLLGEWVARGVEDLDLRDNSGLGGDGLEQMTGVWKDKKSLLPLSSLSLRVLRLDGCAVGDDGLEAVAEACGGGLPLEELFVERCEITLSGCQLLVDSLRGRRLQTLSARANVIGDEGCTLLGHCAEKLDLSSTSLSGQVLPTLGEQPLVALELFSNPSLGPSVGNWCSSLKPSHWQRLDYFDLSGCCLKDEGFTCVCNTLLEQPDLMPSLTFLCMGANDVKDDDAACELVERLGASRAGRLRVVWQNT